MDETRSTSLIPDGRLIFYDCAPNLEQIAISKLAVELLSYELTGEAENILERGHFDINIWLSAHTSNITKHLPVPETVRIKISEQLETIACNISAWIFRHAKIVFFEQSQQRLVLSFFDDFAWSPDGSLNFLRTAENLICSTKLSVGERYRMMCVYCMEDAIEDMYETYEWLENCTELEEFRDNPYVFYWNCVMEGSEAVTPFGENSFEELMVELLPCNTSALGYFFDHLDEDEKHNFGIGRLTVLASEFIRHIIPRYTKIQQKKVFESELCGFIESLVAEQCPRYALQLWNHVKDTITEAQYVEMMQTIFKLDESVFEEGLPNWLAGLGLDIWNSTPISLKQLIWQPSNDQFILQWNRWFRDVHHLIIRDDGFLLQVLSEADPIYRREFWLRQWTELIIGIRPGYLEQFLTICLSSRQEGDDFKQKIFAFDRMHAYFRGLYHAALFTELNQFLETFQPDAKQRDEFKGSLWYYNLPLPGQFLYGSDKPNNEVIDAFAKFLLDCSEQDREVFCDFVDQMVQDPFDDFIIAYYVGDRVFENITYVVERLLSDEELTKHKENWLMQYEYKEDEEDSMVWDKILLWCLGDEAEVEEFKKTC